MSQSDSPVEFRHRGDAVSGQLVGLAKEAELRQDLVRHTNAKVLLSWLTKIYRNIESQWSSVSQHWDHAFEK